MITKITSTNKDEYMQLFESALIDLRNDDNMILVTFDSAEIVNDKKIYYETGSKKTLKYEPNSIYCYKDIDNKYYTSATAEPDIAGQTYYKPKAATEGGAPSSMSTLQEYFFYLEELVNKDEKYAVLPLDEAHFFIDANTRTIDIPTDFKRNGVGVQGDDSAETLYFKINRFFDDMDFGREDVFILVQWEAGGKSGVSNTFRKDITSDPEYVIFGWLLDKNICQAGSIKFSVRIISWADALHTQLLYSFNTLTATLGVNTSLDFEIKELQTNQDIVTLIKNRIKKSPEPSQTIQLNAPVFIAPLEGTEYLDLTNEKAELLAQAYPNPQGIINYVWYTNGIANMTEAGEEGKKYIEVTDKTGSPNYNITYYTLKDGIYKVRSFDETNNEGFDLEETLYQEIGYKNVNIAGKYTVGAKASGTYMTSTETKSKHTWIIPEPLPIELINKTEESFTLRNTDNTIDASTTIKKDDIAKPEDLTNRFYDQITYTWTKKEPAGEDYQADILLKDTNGILTINNPTKESQGYYKVSIVGKRNNVETSSVDKIYKVTLPALKPDVTVPTKAYVGDIISAECNWAQDYQTEMGHSLTYKWYKVANKQEDNVSEEMKRDGFDPDNFSTLFEAGDFGTEASMQILGTGYYCCKVINNYNGDSAFGVSGLCLVNS